MQNDSQPASGEHGSFVLCQSSHGFEIRANLLRVTRYLVVFEVYNLSSILQTSEVLSDFKIVLSDRTVYSGRAIVKSMVNTGLILVCEATLEDSWLDVDFTIAPNQGEKLRAEMNSFIQEWRKLYKVQPEYKLIIADMQTFFTDLRLWLEQVELGIRSSPSAVRAQLEEEVIQQLSDPIIPVINALFDKFEGIAEVLEPDQRPVHQNYMKRQLHPLVLCSPFAYRTYQKPLGYAGDYEMVNMILRNPHEGSSLFAKMMNLWFLLQPPAVAHRNRVDYLVKKLTEETARVASSGSSARILNLGCGPAGEVQRFLETKEYSNRADFTLLDFNEETLQHAQSVLGDIKTRHQRVTPLQFIRKPVHTLIKEAGKHIERPVAQQYDFVYCAGLFDYLTDQVCQRLMNIFYSWLAPGGLLLVTNVDRINPLRNGMEHLLDWHLIYRTSAQAHHLKPQLAGLDSFAVTSDITGVNLFIEVRKPSDV